MAKYYFELKLEIVQEYQEGKRGYGYLTPNTDLFHV